MGSCQRDSHLARPARHRQEHAAVDRVHREVVDQDLLGGRAEACRDLALDVEHLDGLAAAGRLARIHVDGVHGAAASVADEQDAVGMERQHAHRADAGVTDLELLRVDGGGQTEAREGREEQTAVGLHGGLLGTGDDHAIPRSRGRLPRRGQDSGNAGPVRVAFGKGVERDDRLVAGRAARALELVSCHVPDRRRRVSLGQLAPQSLRRLGGLTTEGHHGRRADGRIRVVPCGVGQGP